MSFYDRWIRPRGGAAAGWVGIYSATRERLVAAACASTGSARPRVEVAPVFDAADPAASLLQWQRARARHLRANVMLNSVDYRIVALDAPAVPKAERNAAVRWRLKDELDFSVEDACIDCLAVPGPTLGAESRQIFAVATAGPTVAAWVERFRQARLTIGAVDIPEMAMRNLSVLAAGDDAHAFVHLGMKSTRLALVWQRELCLFRQFNVSGFKLDAADGDTRVMLLERMALEIQRSTDSFSRLFHGADLRTVWVSAVRDADEVCSQLSQLLPQRVEPFRVDEHVELVSDEPVVDATRGLDFTFAIGAALRGAAH